MKTRQPWQIHLRELRSTLKKRFGGVLLSGSHHEDGECCALELASVVRAIPWTDAPHLVNLPDLRGLNDTFIDDAERTKKLLPVLASLWEWPDWTQAERARWQTRCILRSARELIAPLDPDRPWKDAKSLEDVRTCALNLDRERALALDLDRALDLDLALALALDRALARALALAIARALALAIALDLALALDRARADILAKACAIYREEADAITAERKGEVTA